MIGLHKKAVEVVEHEPAWAALAASACQEVRITCAELLTDVQHVGSTAVPDVPAKPILDLAAGILSVDALPDLTQRLTRIGYIYWGDLGSEGGHLFVRESSPDVRTIHLHLVAHNGRQWSNYLLFRDVLCRHPQIREQYARLKAELRSKYPTDRPAYTAAKHDFICRVLDVHRSEQDE
jgi:GrpB-like predicted nucleotidyltransferase (UPF0157 family)